MPNTLEQQLLPPENWQSFEHLCRDLWAHIWGDRNTKRHARQGYPQCGIDIYGLVSGETQGVQCKGKSNYLGKKVTVCELCDEVDKAKKFEPRLESFTLVTSGGVGDKLELEARWLTVKHQKKGLFSVHVYGWSDIISFLHDHPTVIKKHYPHLFKTFNTDEAFNFKNIRKYKNITPLSIPWFLYTQEQIKFVGRTEEFFHLNKFIESDNKFSWFLITGEGGIGKSRLALEFMNRLSDDWICGFINFDKEDPAYYNELFLSSNLFLVFDYVAINIEKVKKILSAIASQELDEKVRVLLIERNQGKENGWWSKLIRTGTSDAILIQELMFEEPLELKPLQNKSAEIVVEFLKKAGERRIAKKVADTKDQQFWGKVERLSDYGRPLYLGLIAALLVENNGKLTNENSVENLLSSQIDRELYRWSLLCENNDQLLHSVINTLGIGTAMRGIPLQSEKSIKLHIENGCHENHVRYAATIFHELFTERLTKINGYDARYSIRKIVELGFCEISLEPDILGEYFLISLWSRWGSKHASHRNAFFPPLSESDITLQMVTAYRLNPINFVYTLDQLRNYTVASSELSSWIYSLINEISESDRPMNNLELLYLVIGNSFISVDFSENNNNNIRLLLIATGKLFSLCEPSIDSQLGLLRCLLNACASVRKSENIEILEPILNLAKELIDSCDISGEAIDMYASLLSAISSEYAQVNNSEKVETLVDELWCFQSKECLSELVICDLASTIDNALVMWSKLRNQKQLKAMFGMINELYERFEYDQLTIQYVRTISNYLVTDMERLSEIELINLSEAIKRVNVNDVGIKEELGEAKVAALISLSVHLGNQGMLSLLSDIGDYARSIFDGSSNCEKVVVTYVSLLRNIHFYKINNHRIEKANDVLFELERIAHKNSNIDITITQLSQCFLNRIAVLVKRREFKEAEEIVERIEELEKSHPSNLCVKIELLKAYANLIQFSISKTDAKLFNKIEANSKRIYEESNDFEVTDSYSSVLKNLCIVFSKQGCLNEATLYLNGILGLPHDGLLVSVENVLQSAGRFLMEFSRMNENISTVLLNEIFNFVENHISNMGPKNRIAYDSTIILFQLSIVFSQSEQYSSAIKCMEFMANKLLESVIYKKGIALGWLSEYCHYLTNQLYEFTSCQQDLFMVSARKIVIYYSNNAQATTLYDRIINIITDEA